MSLQYAEYDNSKKSLTLALILWATIGFTAAQEFYLRRYLSAGAILVLWWGGILESVTIASGFGIAMMLAGFGLFLVMGGLIPSRVRELNAKLLAHLKDQHEWENRHFESMERHPIKKEPYATPPRGSAVRDNDSVRATSPELNWPVRSQDQVAADIRRQRDEAEESRRRRQQQQDDDSSSLVNTILGAELVAAIDTPVAADPAPSIDAGGGSFGGGGADASWSPDSSSSSDSGSSSSYDSGSSSSFDSGSSSSFDSGSSGGFDSSSS